MAKARAKKLPAPTGPVMVSVTTHEAHRVGGQDRAVGDRYEIEDVNLGAVVPRYATRDTEASRPQPKGPPVADEEEADPIESAGEADESPRARKARKTRTTNRRATARRAPKPAAKKPARRNTTAKKAKPARRRK